MDRGEFRELLTHQEWADAQTWRAIRATPAAQPDDRLKWLCHHSHLVKAIYLQHRGQISTRIRELGGEPPLVDFIYWVWAGKPTPEW